MNLKLIDVILIVFLFIGSYLGFKRGIIKSAVSFFGVFIVIALAFMLKNPVSEILYTNLPFIDFGGPLAGLSIINIVIYEAIAFLLLVLIFSFLLKFIVAMTGIVEKILKLTVVLGVVSKLLGLVFGFIEYYIIFFALLFVASNIPQLTPYIDEGELAQKMIKNTPVLSNGVLPEANAIKEILVLEAECGENYTEKLDECNDKSLDIMLKYKVLDKEIARNLINKGKLKIKNADEILERY